MSITAANETTNSSHKEGNKQPTAAASSDRQPPRRSSLAQAASGGSNAVIANKNNKNNIRNDNNHKNKRQQHPPKQQKQQRDENNVGNSSNNNKSKDNNNIIPSPSNDNSTKKLLVDTNLTQLNDDPRSSNPKHRITKNARRNGAGRNTESFNPESTLVRPDLRVHVGSPHVSKFTKKLKHDDVVIVPELFGPEDNWDIYYTLIDEMRAIQQQQGSGNDTKNKTTKNSEWIAWHEGAHLISKNPSGSPTFNSVINRLCEYFSIRKQSIGTRFNWYRDSSDWKPFHHDSAAYNPQRAKSQNITVGVSFGACRELAFLHATPFAKTSNNGGDNDDDKKCRVYFPQTNNGVFSFGRDVNIHWKHGINALSDEEQDGKGRISIILWGLVEDVIEEGGSPALLGSDGVGPHAAGQGGGGGYKNRRRGNNSNNRGGRR